MKKNIFALSLLLAVSLSLNGINNPDNTNFDFEDQTPAFKELLFGNKPTQSISAKPAPAVTPPATVSKPQVVTPAAPVVEAPETTLQPIIVNAQKINLEREQKLEELQNAAKKAYANAHNADALAACSAWLAIPTLLASVGFFIVERQTESILAIGAFLGCIASAGYFEKKMSSYGQEARIALEEYDSLKDNQR